MVVGKPGLDGHSNGAEQVAVRARDAGIDAVYEGIRLTPGEIVDAARRNDAHVVGLSILSGSHVELVREVVRLMGEAGMGDVPVVVGGIIPAADEGALGNMGVARVYTPKDYDLNRILGEILELLE
jgi:(2R)-ethylmalonyl-CoA mutase